MANRVLMVVDKSPWPSSSGSRVRIAELWSAFEPGSRRMVLCSPPTDLEQDALESTVPGEYSFAPRDGTRLLPHLDQEARDWGADVIWASGPWPFNFQGYTLSSPTVVDLPSLAGRLLRAELLSHAAMVKTAGEGRRLVAKAIRAPKRLAGERRALARARVVTPCSVVEQMYLSRGAREKSVIVPNGASLLPFREPTVDRPRLLFVGTLHYPPNADAAVLLAERIVPSIRRHIPDVVLDVVGAGPPRVLDRLRSEQGVSVHGFVDDLEPFYAQAAQVIVPIRRLTGTNIKILEAIAHSVPVVTTSIGLEGIPELVPGYDVAVASDWRGCAELSSALLADRAAGVALASSAWRRADQCLSWALARATLRQSVDAIRADRRQR